MVINNLTLTCAVHTARAARAVVDCCCLPHTHDPSTLHPLPAPTTPSLCRTPRAPATNSPARTQPARVALWSPARGRPPPRVSSAPAGADRSSSASPRFAAWAPGRRSGDAENAGAGAPAATPRGEKCGGWLACTPARFARRPCLLRSPPRSPPLAPRLAALAPPLATLALPLAARPPLALHARARPSRGSWRGCTPDVETAPEKMPLSSACLPTRPPVATSARLPTDSSRYATHREQPRHEIAVRP